MSAFSLRRTPWTKLAAWALAAFFLTGVAVNLRPPPPILQDYARWGYPSWFHYVTGVLELATAVLLVTARTRLYGAVLGALVMGAALLTVILHGEFAHATAPGAVLAGLLTVGFRSRRGQ